MPLKTPKKKAMVSIKSFFSFFFFVEIFLLFYVVRWRLLFMLFSGLIKDSCFVSYWHRGSDFCLVTEKPGGNLCGKVESACLICLH